MRAVADTSVIVASVLSGSAAQAECAEALDLAQASAAGHAWFESFSVLTRLPAHIRLTPHDAHRVVTSAVHGVRLLSSAEQRTFQQWLARSSIAGGAVYDAMVGWVARAAHLPLLTRDARALPVYRLLGIEVLLVGSSAL